MAFLPNYSFPKRKKIIWDSPWGRFFSWFFFPLFHEDEKNFSEIKRYPSLRNQRCGWGLGYFLVVGFLVRLGVFFVKLFGRWGMNSWCLWMGIFFFSLSVRKKDGYCCCCDRTSISLSEFESIYEFLFKKKKSHRIAAASFWAHFAFSEARPCLSFRRWMVVGS